VSAVDWRLAPLVLFIKHWAKVQGINDASQGTVSSYSLVLMVIHYLQCQFQLSLLLLILYLFIITTALILILFLFLSLILTLCLAQLLVGGLAWW